jgi:hypothetical protein
MPVVFLSSQGVSMQITETAIAFYNQFSHHRFGYIANSLLLSVVPDVGSELGALLDGDITYFLGPEAARAGYGAGGAYLAEAYAFAKMPGVFFESVLIGLLLAWMALRFHGPWTPFAFTMMLSVLYIPRDSLAVALSRTVLTWVLISGILAVAWFLEKATAQLKPLLRAASATIEQRELRSGADHF